MTEEKYDTTSGGMILEHHIDSASPTEAPHGVFDSVLNDVDQEKTLTVASLNKDFLYASFLEYFACFCLTLI